jgi:large subunit ribosomal protein L13
MAKLAFDGSGAVLGRAASAVAKELLKGNSVDLINCEEIIVSGDKRKFAESIRTKRDMGRGSSLKGPKYIRVADRLVKRMIRGMLPRDTARGREAFKRLKCYVGSIKIDEGVVVQKFDHRKPMKFSTIKEVVRLI